MPAGARRPPWRGPAPGGPAALGWGKRESQLGHAVSLATGANVPAAPDGMGA